MAPFRVPDTDGRPVGGAHALPALRATLPGWLWLARVGRGPGATWATERSDRLFPALRRWASRPDRPA